MRWGRIAGLVLAGAAALAAALVVLALQPSLQTWALRRYLAGHPEWGVEVGRISAGWSGATAHDVTVGRPGCVFRAPAVEVEMPVLSLIFNRPPVAIRRIVAEGWTLDFTRGRAVAAARRPREFSFLSSAEAAPPPQPAGARRVFRGLFSRQLLPWDLRVESVEGEGDLLLPPPAGRPGELRAHARIRGGGIAPGREANFEFHLEQNFPAGTAPIASVRVNGRVMAALGGDGRLAGLTARLNSSAASGKLPHEVRLTVDLGALRTEEGETYTLSLVRDGKALASLSADYATRDPRLAGAWKFNLSDEDIVSFALGRSLPDFTLVGEGRFDTDEALVLAHVSGRLTADTDQLGVLWPRLAGVGRTRTEADFDLAHRSGLWRIDRLQAAVAGAHPILEVRALQAFAFNIHSGQLQVADSSRDLFRVSLWGVPVAWLEPFTAPWSLEGDPIEGEIVASARAGGLTVRSASPLTVTGTSVARGGRLFLHGLEFHLDATGDFTPQGWQVDASARLASSAPLLAASAKIGRLSGPDQPVKIAATFSSHLPAWSAQPGIPALPGADPALLVSGDLEGSLSASLDRRRSVHARAAVTDLAFGSGAELRRYSRVSAEARADWGRGQPVTFTVPIVMEGEGHKSDITLDGTLADTRNGLTVDARAESGRLILDDARLLGALWLLHGAAGGAIPRGKLVLACREVEAGAWAASGLKGALYALPGTLELDGVSGFLAGCGAFTINGTLGYGEDRRQPCSLRAEVALDNFEAAPIFRALNPGRPPILEGRCNLSGRLDGKGATPRDALARSRGDFTLTSVQGVVRALRAEVVDDIRQSPSRLAEAVDSVTSLFSKSNAARTFIDKQGQMVVQITDAFKEIHYDQLRVTAERGPNLDVRLDEFSLISPEIRLTGKGSITYQDSVAFSHQPLQLDLAVGARGHLAELMNGVGLLGTRKDDLGYAVMASPVELTGSLDEIDPSEWRELLIKAAMRKAGSLLDKLLGK